MGTDEFSTTLGQSEVSMMRRYTAATAVAALMLLAGCGSSAATSQNHKPTRTSTPLASSTQDYRIGESFTLPGSNNTGNFRLTVDGVSSTVTRTAVQAYSASLGSTLNTHPDPGQKWVIVAIHATNTGNEPAFFLTQFFVLTAGGKQFDVSLSDTKAQHVADGYNSIKNRTISSELNPEQTGYEWVVYQVPKRLPVQSLLISADVPSNGASARVDLTRH
jgi:hypothetical protein